MRVRIVFFLLATVVLCGVATGYTLYAVDRDRAELARHAATGVQGPLDVGPQAPPGILFRDTDPGPDYGRLAVVSRDSPGGVRTVGPTSCQRVYAAGGTVVCLAGEGKLIVRNHAIVFDAEFRPIAKLPVAGLPNRARVSASGRMASWTVFTYGDDYASASFSTRTSLYDVRTGRTVDSLEDFTTYKDGKVFAPADRNYWGVTFAADDNTFYATVSPVSQGRTYLVRGDFAERSMTILRENVECPSLSPDNTRIAFKKKVSGDRTHPWRLFVLDLATMTEAPLAETQSVDDQPAWIDDATVAYGLPVNGNANLSNVWSTPADGSGAPTLLVADAFSPAVLGG